MNPNWLTPQTMEEAVRAQKEMAQQIILQDILPAPLSLIGGVDVSNTPFDPLQRIFSAVVVLSAALAPLETATRAERQTFPYIPGLLGFREAPALVRTFAQLSTRPQLLLVDGHGISHPRGLGIASHLGVLLDIPTIGVAKSILIGKPASSLSPEIGSTTPLVWKGKEIGKLLRTKKNSLPLIISAGHKITLNTALEWVKKCLRGYRLPEPTRQAHLAANICRKDYAQAPHL